MADLPSTRASLIVRLRDAQDTTAWAQFIDLYTPQVYGYARKQGLQDADAADLSQEVMRIVATAVGRLDYDPLLGSFRNWLFTIVRRKLSHWRTASARRQCGSGDSALHQILEQRPAPEEEAEWEAEWQRRQFAWASEQVRREVTDATWQAFWSTAVEGQPGKQVAATLGLSVAAVYLARSRVLARLKDLIQSVQDP